jgi:hypothetical protein
MGSGMHRYLRCEIHLEMKLNKAPNKNLNATALLETKMTE